MITLDAALVLWVVLLLCTAGFALRRDWRRARLFAAGSVAISILIAILNA